MPARRARQMARSCTAAARPSRYRIHEKNGGMFVVDRAERPDVLADVLAELFLEAPGDPFTPEVVAVHSRGVERWLSHRLAARLGTSRGRADGVCANLRFPFPGRLVGDALAKATGGRSRHRSVAA